MEYSDSPSERFLRLFAGSGTAGPVRECQCGITNYSGNPSLMEEGEFEKLERERSQDPDKFYRHDDGDNAVSERIVGGSTFVLGCPCNGLRSFELFLQQNIKEVGEYYKELKKESQQKVDELIFAE